MKILFTFFILGIHSFSFLQEQVGILNVYFEHDDAKISTKARTEIDSVLKSGELFKIKRVVAYCDPNGSEAYNYNLAERRLKATLKELLVQSREKYSTLIFGENYPDKKEAQKEHHLLRRVEIHYTIFPIEVHNDPSIFNSFEEINIDPEALAKSAPIVLKIQFINGLAVLLDSSYQEIENLYSFMSKNKNIHAMIRGHVCCTNDYPMSKERAMVVYRILVEKGISSSRLKYNGFSNTIPFVTPELTEYDKQQNRRVDVIFTIQE